MAGMDRLVPVALFSHSAAAHLARAELEDHGIQAFVLDEAMATLFGPDVIPVKLVVAEPDEERARQILGLAQEEGTDGRAVRGGQA